MPKETESLFQKVLMIDVAKGEDHEKKARLK